MVIYEHNYVVGAVEGNDPVWTLAGKVNAEIEFIKNAI